MSTTPQTYFPDKPIHPGASLADELDFLSLSVTDLATRTGISKKHLSNIINGKASITPEVALRLEKVTGTKAKNWNNLTRNYQASLAAVEERAHIADEVKFLEDFRETYKELVDKKILPKLQWKKNNFLEITRLLLGFFGTHSLSFVPQTQEAAYRRYEQKINRNTMAAVIRLGERKAQSVQTEQFDKKSLMAALPEIKSYSLKSMEEYMPLLEEKLRTLGIVMVCVPGFMHTGIQGAAKWLDTDKALVILKSDGQTYKTRFEEGKFWFNLFHEIGHLVLHSRKRTFIDLKTDDVNSTEEEEANDFAVKHLVGGEINLSDLQQYKRGASISADLAVPDLARKRGVAQSIIAGHLTHRFKKNQDNVYLVLDGYSKKISYTNYEMAIDDSA